MGLKIPFWLYVTVGTIGAAIINAGLNGAISIAMYQNGKAERAGLWVWPDTIAGDVFVTCLLTGLLQTVISTQLTIGDLGKDQSGAIYVRVESRPRQENASRLTLLLKSKLVSLGNSQYPFLTRVGLLLSAAVPIGLFVAIVFGIPSIFIAESITNDEWTIQNIALYKAALTAIVGLVVQPTVVIPIGVTNAAESESDLTP